jgi:ribonuclease BN (tRNA processing enzyme)
MMPPDEMAFGIRGQSMKVTFTGTGAGTGYDHDRGGASVMLENDGGVILLDCGPGVMRPVYQSGVSIGDINAVFITHLYFDHAVDLPELFNMFGRSLADPPRIFGPRGIVEYVENSKKLIVVNGLKELTEGLQQLRGEEIAPSEAYEVTGFTADAIEVPHDPLVQALAWRFRSDGMNVVVSGDQATDDTLMVPFSSDADLLVHEAHTKEVIEKQAAKMPKAEVRAKFINSFSYSHSEVSSAAKVAERTGVKRLALTALLPLEDETVLVNLAKDHYNGEVFVANTGESLEI